MEQLSGTVERARLIVAIILRFIAIAALLRALWWVGLRLVWDLSDAKLSDNTKLTTWFVVLFFAFVGVGIFVTLDWLVGLLVPGAPLGAGSTRDTIDGRRVGADEVVASLVLAGVRTLGGGMLLIGLWALITYAAPVGSAYTHQTDGWGWAVAGYLLQVGFFWIIGSVIIVFDRRIALWLGGLRCGPSLWAHDRPLPTSTDENETS